MRITGPEIRHTTDYKPPPAELVSGIFRLVKGQLLDRSAHSESISALQLAGLLRHDIGPVKRGCEMLEAHGVITRVWATQSHTSPRYRITPTGNWAARADAQSISDCLHRPLAEVVAQSWGRYFGASLALASLVIGAWEQTEEDVTAFVCAAGQAEGSIGLSMDQGFLLESLALAGGHDFRGLNRAVRNYFQTLVGNVAADVGREIAATGFDISLSSAVTLVDRGALLSKPRDSRYLMNLTNRFGRLKVRVTLRDAFTSTDQASD